MSIRSSRVSRRALAATTVVALVAAGALMSATASAQHRSGGTLTIAASQAPSSLDPALTGNDGADLIYSELAYAPLMNLGNNSVITPGLAKSWSYIGSGNKRFRMTIRSGAMFADGSAVTAQAVADSINYWRQAKGPVSAYTAAIKSVTAINASTVEVVCSTADPELPLVFSRVLLAGDIISPAGLQDPNALKSQTFGAGPYTLDPSQTVVGSTYTYVPNKHYWNQSAIHFQQIVVKVIANDNSALSALRTGQANVALVGANTAASAGGGLKIYSVPSQIHGLYLVDRRAGSPLGNLKVRQALNYAVDRTKIAKAVFGKFATPTDEFSVPGYDSWDPSYSNHYAYNPAKAKQLLAAAGYAKGFTLGVASLNLFDMSTVTQAIGGYLAKVGVKLQIDATPTVAAYVQAGESKKYPTISLYYGGLPMFVMFGQVFAKNAGLFNPFASDNPLYDRLAAEGAVASPAKLPAIWKQLQRAIVNQAWQLPVAVSHETWLTTSNVTGFVVGAGNLTPDVTLITGN